MQIILFLLLFLIIGFVMNEFYFWIVLGNRQEQQILKAKKRKNYSWVSFGSAYCRYGLFPSEEGFNFGVASQFFYYTDKMLREYTVQCLKKGGIVFIIIADLVFSEVGKGLYGADRYQLLLSKRSLGDEYSFLKKMNLRYSLLLTPKKLKAMIRYIIKGNGDNYSSLFSNTLDKDMALTSAKQRCKDWCDQFGLRDTFSPNISRELEIKFAETRDILTGMIQFCYDNGYQPFLVVTPVSDIMNSQLGDKFIRKVLYDNISLANQQGAPLLDYLKDKRFQNISLYHNNADFLNAKGRGLFTNVLLQDAFDIIHRV